MPRTFNFRYDDLAEVLRAKLQGVRRAQQAQGAGGGNNATTTFGRVSEGAPHQYNVSAASSRQQARGMRRRSDWMRRRRSEAAAARDVDLPDG